MIMMFAGCTDMNCPRKTLSGLRSFLADLPLDWRRKVPGLDPARADIIVPGARILEHVMDLLGFTLRADQ